MAFRFEIKATEIPVNIQSPRPRRIFERNAVRGVKAGLDIMLSAVRQATPVNTGTTRVAWSASPVRLAAGVVSGEVKISGGAGDVALILERGARPHFPPVPRNPTAEPVLGTWLRRSRKFNPFVVENGQKRVLDPTNIRDVRSAAFKISQRIRTRGFPRPGRKKKIFERAIDQVGARITQINERVRDNIVRELGD